MNSNINFSLPGQELRPSRFSLSFVSYVVRLSSQILAHRLRKNSL
jgi:hypothetical protein